MGIVIDPSLYIIGKVMVSAQIFFGIRFGRLFVQIATSDNEVFYQAESTIKDNGICKILGDMFPDYFYKMEIKFSRKNLLFFDGERIKNDGEIENCLSVRDIFPDLRERLAIICR